MLFNSYQFICFFLPITLLGFFLLCRIGKAQYAIGWLVLASLFYYGYWNPIYLFLLLGSITVNYLIGLALGQYQDRGKSILFGGVLFNLGLLGYFKYANFFIDNLNIVANANLQVAHIVLPLAISFITFQKIAYLVDTYYSKQPIRNLSHYSLFVTFFPQLIAGPIVHHKEVVPQFQRPEMFRLHPEMLADGIVTFLIGLFKKAALADPLALYADPVFTAAANGETLTFFEAWGGLLAYAFQLYFDFSGYSDMAIGLGRMFGIELPLNFNSPYRARSITELWKRWHITLTRFLRNYVYIPLGGNQKGEVRRYVNAFATMFLAGIWHGAGWTFIIWGTLEATFLTINNFWQALQQRFRFKPRGLLYETLCWFLAFNAFVVPLCFFRGENVSGAIIMLKGIFGLNGALLPDQIISFVPWLAFFADPARIVPYLAGGTVLGLVELICFLMLSAIICFGFRNIHQMTRRARLWLLVPTFGLTLQAVFFRGVPSSFLYFQF